MDSEKIASDFLEISSEQRLNILKNLFENNLNISKLAKLLGATNSEIHRNIGRLAKNELIIKSPDGNYELTTFGVLVLKLIPSFNFVSENKLFFNKHSLENIETKFLQRIGSLQSKKQIKGYVKVLEKWKKIHENSEKFIYNILSEVPYSNEIIDIISNKLEKEIPIKSIFLKNVIIPEDRRKIFEKRQFQKYVTKGILERRMSSVNLIGLFLTDKEAAIFFHNKEGDVDLSEMFSSTEKEFRDWCLDYFENAWKNSTTFQEGKLKE
ncbi:transcriptional regulator [Nitrosopumilus sp. b3]|uniref:helix-turn-helix transcriptional regulator n=1 Tax=Nitrosopumilus sp. b3 TaxID=2109909 RepID=UPI0015F756FD|nr:transcriptional regulator [Nitrosopumilus sp. b3]KAF6247389.1 transcriptional regulator [Nitrosopumilus sp. b3]